MLFVVASLTPLHECTVNQDLSQPGKTARGQVSRSIRRQSSPWFLR
jgi:hypothetical protein